MKTLSKLFCAALISTAAVVATTPLVRAAGMMPDVGAGAQAPAGLSEGSLDVPTGVSAGEVRDTIAYSLAARSWIVKEKSEARVVGYLNHRGHEATITFLISPASIEVYCDGYKVNKAGERTKPERPEGWIKNIKNDVTKRLQIKAATK